MLKILSTAGVIAMLAVSASAATLKYETKLRGASVAPEAVSTDARGKAKLKLKTKKEMIKLKVRVRNLDLDDLLDDPDLGPIQLYAGEAGEVGEVIAPFSLDDFRYKETKKGFKLKVKKIAFDDTNVASGMSFDDFATLVAGGGVYVDVDTNANESGELRGQFNGSSKPISADRVQPAPAPVPLPATGLMLMGGLGLLVARRKTKSA